MQLSQYQLEAQNTKSTAFHGDKVALRIFIERTKAAIEALKLLDEVKKTLFYGKHYDGLVPNECVLNCNNLQLHNLHNFPQGSFDVLHGIIGKATEAGELLEGLYAAVIDNKPLDGINIIEEIGDGFWYDAILLEPLGSDFETCAEINNAKLRLRFPNKFTEADAVNRDLFEERSVLEASATAAAARPKIEG